MSIRIDSLYKSKISSCIFCRYPDGKVSDKTNGGNKNKRISINTTFQNAQLSENGDIASFELQIGDIAN